MNLGIKHKKHLSTKVNINSSRSHTIFTIYYQKHFSKDNIEENTLSIADLAGAERLLKSDVTGNGFKETCKINQSLNVLSRCFEALKHNNQTNFNKQISSKRQIPIRESKLTMLFQDYLLGDANIILISHISLLKQYEDDNLRILSYSSMARSIKPAKSKVNSNLSKTLISKSINSHANDQVSTPKKELNESFKNNSTPMSELEQINIKLQMRIESMVKSESFLIKTMQNYDRLLNEQELLIRNDIYINKQEANINFFQKEDKSESIIERINRRLTNPNTLINCNNNYFINNPRFIPSKNYIIEHSSENEIVSDDNLSCISYESSLIESFSIVKVESDSNLNQEEIGKEDIQLKSKKTKKPKKTKKQEKLQEIIETLSEVKQPNERIIPNREDFVSSRSTFNEEKVELFESSDLVSSLSNRLSESNTQADLKKDKKKKTKKKKKTEEEEKEIIIDDVNQVIQSIEEEVIETKKGKTKRKNKK